MASRTTTDPLEILLEMGVDLDNLSEEEDYLSALIEATNTLTIKSASDPRIRILQQEIRKVRQKRKAADTKFKARKTTVSASKLTNRSSAPTQRKQMSGATFFALPPATDQKKEEKKKGSPNNLLKEISETVTGLQKSNPDLSTALLEALEKLRQTTEWMLSQKDMADRFAGAVPYLRGFARVLGGYYHLCAAAHEKGDGARTKLATFYIHSLLPEYSGLLAQAMQGADDLYALENTGELDTLLSE